MNRTVRGIALVASILSVIAGFVGDFIQPLFPFSGTVAVGTFFLLLATIAISRLSGLQQFIDQLPEEQREQVQSVWPKALMLTLLSVCLFFGGVSLVSKRYEDQGGYLASVSPAVAEAQGALGIIDQRLTNIEMQLGKLAKETSDNPRKELSNLGYPWSEQGFLDSVKQGDRQAVALFRRGGFEPSASVRSSLDYWIVTSGGARGFDAVVDAQSVGFDLDTRVIHYSSQDGATTGYAVSAHLLRTLEQHCEDEGLDAVDIGAGIKVDRALVFLHAGAATLKRYRESRFKIDKHGLSFECYGFDGSAAKVRKTMSFGFDQAVDLLGR